MVRDQERHIKVTRTVYEEGSDAHETIVWEGPPEVVKETLYDLGIFPRPKAAADSRSSSVNPSSGLAIESLEGTPIEEERPQARWRQIAEFIEVQGPPEYLHSQAMIEKEFVGRRLSAVKEKATYAGWFRPSRKARKHLQGKLGGLFRRERTAGSDGSYMYRFLKR